MAEKDQKVLRPVVALSGQCPPLPGPASVQVLIPVSLQPSQEAWKRPPWGRMESGSVLLLRPAPVRQNAWFPPGHYKPWGPPAFVLHPRFRTFPVLCDCLHRGLCAKLWKQLKQATPYSTTGSITCKNPHSGHLSYVPMTLNHSKTELI